MNVPEYSRCGLGEAHRHSNQLSRSWGAGKASWKKASSPSVDVWPEARCMERWADPTVLDALPATRPRLLSEKVRAPV